MKALLCSLLVFAFALTTAHAASASGSLSATETYATLSERTGLSKAQVKAVLDEMTKLAYREASVGFTIPGIGKLSVSDRAARMGRNPITGEPIQIAAKKTVKFTISKACKDAILGTGK